jgi:hypothetical protein
LLSLIVAKGLRGPVCGDDRWWRLGAGWYGGVLLLGDVGSPDGAVGVVVDFEHREVGDESVGRGAVPAILSWLEEDAIAGPDDLFGPPRRWQRPIPWRT